MAMFIRIDLDHRLVRQTPGLARKLVEICPVKIFQAGADDRDVGVVEENVDECTLCDLCTKASPEGVTVVKLYEG